jgi:transposase InsO family protein
MGIHKNAPLTPAGREILVRRVLEGRQSVAAVATDMGVSRRTVRKWVGRFEVEGLAGLQDRSSRPHCSPNRTAPRIEAKVAALRRRRWTGLRIALATGLAKATVHRILRRLGLNRLKSLEPAEPVRRYERDAPGELIHIDIKKLGRFNKVGHRITGDRTRQSNQRNNGTAPGWEFVHVCVDDHSRIAYVEIKADEKKESAVAFLRAAVAYYARLGVRVERVMTDNGSCYRSKAFAKACQALGIKHIFTRPYTPRTNGKAERFIQTTLREWAYAQAYANSDRRAAELPLWLHRYNWHRPHGSLKAKPPISRIGLTGNNLMRLHI